MTVIREQGELFFFLAECFNTLTPTRKGEKIILQRKIVIKIYHGSKSAWEEDY